MSEGQFSENLTESGESPEDLKEINYKKALEAIESIDEMINGKRGGVDDEIVFPSGYDPEKGRPFCDAIYSGIEAMRDRLMDKKEKSNFFKTLPIINKLSMKFGYDETIDFIDTTVEDDNLEDLSGEAKYLLYEGFQNINSELLGQLSNENIKDFFKSLSILLKTPKYDYIETAISFLKSNKETLSDISKSRNLPAITYYINEIEKFLATKEFKHVLADAAQQKIDYDADAQRGLGRQPENIDLAKDLIEGYGIDFQEAIKAWERLEYDDEDRLIRKTINLAPNLRSMIDLDYSHSGLVVFLNENCGILNFDRYPEELLIDQYEKKNEFEKPYGVIVMAQSDWNGAFSHKSRLLERLYNDIRKRYNIRIIESETKRGVAKGLIGANKKYGKASFGFICGHGSPDSIMFGKDNNEGQRLHIDDLLGKGVKKTGKFFKPDPRIILMSCSTGKEGGIGQKISEVIEEAGIIKVCAPNIPTSIKKIDVSMEGENIDFKVEYYNDDEAQAMVYEGGKPVK